MPPKKIKIVEKNLGRERAAGQYHEDLKLVEIDPRQNAKEYYNTAIHELLHHACPYMAEGEVDRVAEVLRDELWKLNYRKVVL